MLNKIRKPVFLNMFKPARIKRTLLFLIFDVAVIVFSLYLAMLLRFEYRVPEAYGFLFNFWAPLLSLIWVVALAVMGLYRINWRFVGLIELKNTIISGFTVIISVITLNYMLNIAKSSLVISRGVLLISVVLSFLLICFMRIAKRLYFLIFRGVLGKGTMIVGIDGMGERLIMELINEKKGDLLPRVIIDLDSIKNKTRIHGVPVYSDFSRINEFVTSYTIQVALINLKGSERKLVPKVFSVLQEAGVKDIRIVPSISEFSKDAFKTKHFKQLDLEDLLAREPVKVEEAGISHFLSEKTVLVTGAAGSIGSEIVRKLTEFGTKRVICYEIDETEIFNFKNELFSKNQYKNTELIFILGDVRDYSKLSEIYSRFRPQIVFHTAAYKHVPILEDFPEEAIKTNVIGAYNVFLCAKDYNCNCVVNISTDKAVSPISVMGMSKRITEIMGGALSTKETRIISVRFGNVLGSRGSVIPLFLEQISKGGPITITHEEMKRYFMSIPEAVLLVFQAACMGGNGEVYVLDMGEPVKILDLAQNLIRMNGLVPNEDIKIVYSGLRPGEKLYEDLLTEEEGCSSTTHEKIFIAKLQENWTIEEVEQRISALKKIIGNSSELKRLMDDENAFFKNTFIGGDCIVH